MTCVNCALQTVHKKKIVNIMQCIVLGTSLSPGTLLLMFLIALLSTGYAACFSFSLTTWCIPNFHEICISVHKLLDEMEIKKKHLKCITENTTLVAFGTVYPIFFLISNSHHNFVGNKS